jgi:hypothetical protein
MFINKPEQTMGLLEVVLIVLVILFLFGGGYGYQRRTDWGRGPVSLFGILVVIVVVILLFRVL